MGSHIYLGHLQVACVRACPREAPRLSQPRHSQYQAWRCAASNRDSLHELSDTVHRSFFELCIQNQGRPAAAALADLVKAAVLAFEAGVSMDKLTLQLSHERSDWSIDVAGSRLTQSEKDYRQRWLDTVYITLQLCTLEAEREAGFAAVAALRPWAPEDAGLHSIVERTLHGQATGEQQLAVTFDRAIATGGASGGAAALHNTIAPSFFPISQLVLLTLKVRNELRGARRGPNSGLTS